MAKEICSNCNTKMSPPVSFCPGCSRPTEHASEAELLEWDLGQWRRHVEASVSSGAASAPPVALRSVAVAPDRPGRKNLQVIVRPEAVTTRQAETPVDAEHPAPRTRVRRRAHRPKVAKPRLRLPNGIRPRRQDRDRVIILDSDHAFVYTSCTSCERADWIVRTTRNEDGTYNYWCVRCSRSFKTDARLPHGWKPFLASGSVIGALATLSIVMG